MNDTRAPSNPQPQVRWSDDASRELDEAIERAWLDEGGVRAWLDERQAKFEGAGKMAADATVLPRVRRRRGAKQKLSPELIKEAQADLQAWGRPLRPYAPALARIANFLKRKGRAVDKRQFKTFVRWVIKPLLSEDQKPKKRQPRKITKVA